MITDSRALDERKLPETIVERNAEQEQLAACLRPIEHGVDPHGARVVGDRGMGKTHCVRVLLDELADQCSGSGFDSQYITCWEDSSRQG